MNGLLNTEYEDKMAKHYELAMEGFNKGLTPSQLLKQGVDAGMINKVYDEMKKLSTLPMISQGLFQK